MKQTNTPKFTTQIQSRHIKLKNQQATRSRHSKYRYNKPLQFTNYLHNRTQIYNPQQPIRKRLQNNGNQILRKYPSIIIFAGGYGNRCELQKQEQQNKQFKKIIIQNNQTTLFDITMNSIKDKLNHKYKITIYIICNRLNSQKIINQIQSLSTILHQIPMYIAYQKQENVLDFNGSQNVFSRVGKNLTYPCGIGAFKDAIVYYDLGQKYTLGKHITDIVKPKYVYCLGTTNCYQQGIDIQMLGLIQQYNLDCVFKCNYQKNINQQLHMICLRQYTYGHGQRQKQKQVSWLVMEYKNLCNLIPKQYINQIKQFPIWMDNFVFNPKILQENNSKNIHQQSLLKYQFNNRNLRNKTGQQFNCIIAQVTISYALMKDKTKCVGYIPNCKYQTQHHFLKTKDDFVRVQAAMKSKSPSRMTKGLKRRSGMGESKQS